MLAHFTLTPGRPGWLDARRPRDRSPEAGGWKACTIGDFVLANGGLGAYGSTTKS